MKLFDTLNLDMRMENDQEKTQDTRSIPDPSDVHPSRSLKPRARGYGIGGGYETLYRARSKPSGEQSDAYGPLPHSGYYGVGSGPERFKQGQASFGSEVAWYDRQYGERTSDRQTD